MHLKRIYNCLAENRIHESPATDVIFCLLSLLLVRLSHRCSGCSHIVVAIHRSTGLDTFCRLIEQVVRMRLNKDIQRLVTTASWLQVCNSL